MSRTPAWTFVYSEYLDLPFALRQAGEQVVSARSAREAIDCLRAVRPARIVIDTTSYEAARVLALARDRHPDVALECHEEAIERLVVS